METKNSSIYNIIQKNKTPGNNFNQEYERFYPKNNKPLLKQIKDLNKWKNIPGSFDED